MVLGSSIKIKGSCLSVSFVPRCLAPASMRPSSLLTIGPCDPQGSLREGRVEASPL